MRTPLIGLVGRKGAGKSTFARLLADDHGYEELAFADRLREDLTELDPLVWVPDSPSPRRLANLVDSIGWDAAKQYPDVRATMQRYGDTIRRADPEYFVRPVARLIEGRATPVVVSDVRFQNEAKAVRDAGGILMRVNGYSPKDEQSKHWSETGQSLITVTTSVNNYGTLEDLASVVPLIIKDAEQESNRAR